MDGKWEICCSAGGFVIVPPDRETAYLIGDKKELRGLTERLIEYDYYNKIDGEISENDSRLGAKWLSVSEVSEKYGIPISTVRTWTLKIETQRRRGRTVMPEKRIRHQVALWEEWKAGSRPHLTKKEKE